MNDKKKQQADRIQHYARLIEKQTGRAVRPYRADGYMNLMNRYGTSKDTTEHYKFVPEATVPDETLTTFYEGNGLFAKIIDAPAEEAIKHGFVLDDVSDNDIEDFYVEALDELDWEEIAMTGIKWARLFGGAIAVMLINDGGGLEEPLNWKLIKSIDDIRIYDRSVIQPEYSTMFSYDPRDPFRTRGSRLGMPEYYHVNSRFGSFTVHESRCLVFQNGILPENSSNSLYQLWGMPEYIRIHRALRDAELAHSSAPKMLDRSVQPVYKMKELSSLLATEEGESLVLKRLQVIDLARGLLNSLVIDADGEDYDFKSFQFSGVADVIDATCNLLSALTNIPQTILFGRSPAGMNSTGESDLENWYSYVQRIQKRMIRSNLRYLLSIIFQAGVATGEVDEVPKIKIKFNPLWTMSDTEQADLEQKKAQIALTKAQTVQTYVNLEVLDPTEVRQGLADSGEFDIDTILDEYEDEEDLLAAYEGMETDNPGTNPESGDFAQYSAEVDVEKHETDPGTEGSAPANAPAATKLPQDMSEEEVEEIDKQDEAPFGVGVLVVKDGRILCGTRHNDTGYGLICGPGGHGEKGETYEQSAFRETEEEFGISPKELIPIGVGPFEPESGLRSHIFLCTDFDGEPDCVDLEMTNPKFRTLEELEALKPSLFPPFADSLEILKDCVFNDNEDGGPGSGNHGHKGVAGQVGGSAPSDGSGAKPKKTKAETAAAISKLKDAPRMKPKGQFKKAVFPLAGAEGDPQEQLEMYKISIDPVDMSQAREEVVSIDKLQTVQLWTDVRKLNGIANAYEDVDDITPEGETDGLPIIVKYKDQYILRDGNHRATVAKLQGKESIRANVIDWESTKTDTAENISAAPEKPIDFSPENNTIKSQETSEDGAPQGNDNAAGPHKKKGGRGHVVSAKERKKMTKRFKGATSSKGTVVTGFSDHAFDRVGGREISAGRIQSMLDSTDTKPDKTHPDRTLYDVPGSRLVLADDGTVVSVMWRKNKKGK